MKRFLLVIAILVFTGMQSVIAQPANPKAVTNTGKSSSIAPLPPEMQRIKDRGTLLVAMYAKDVIPYLMADSMGNLAGNDVDLAKNIAKALQVNISIDRSAKTFNELVDLVASGKADMGISLISRTLARAEKVRFSNPYVIVRPVLVLNRLTASRAGLDLSNPLEEMSHFNGKIAEPKGNSYIDFAKAAFPKASLIELPTWDDVLNAVFEGKVLATLRDEIGVKNYLMKYPERSVQLKTIPIMDPARADALGIAVNSTSTHLLEWINLYLELNYPIRSAEDLVKTYDKYYKK
ncbi:substrate-binding periplasmic protein [Undibacterium sp. SXout7W]|uniref:substrate-binding periplasmic protein n=1 Tax=Undibacterium sp. SXout7W TaxID=3413049 RepID=UPI003BF32CE8